MSVLREFDPPKAKAGTFKPTHGWAEPKLDGVRIIIHCHPDIGVVITTRRRNKEGVYNQIQDKVTALRDNPQLLGLASQGYTILDGELLLPNSSLGDLMGVVGSAPASAQLIQEKKGNAYALLFDIPQLFDTDLVNQQLQYRRNIMEQGVYQDELIKLVAYHHVPICRQQSYLEAQWAEGREGAIFKDPFAPYFGYHWLKHKKKETLDMTVVGWDAGNGKYEGTIGALWLKNGPIFTKCAPGDDNTRARLMELFRNKTTEQIEAMNIVVEVEHQELTKHHSLRHPRIIRWRTDLSEVSAA